MVKDYSPHHPLKKKKKKKKKKVLDHYLHHDLGMPPLLWCFFAHLLILEYPDHHQHLISSSLYYTGPLHKISSQSIHNFLTNVVHRQTDKQTNPTKNITSFAKEVIINDYVWTFITLQTDGEYLSLGVRDRRAEFRVRVANGSELLASTLTDGDVDSGNWFQLTATL